MDIGELNNLVETPELDVVRVISARQNEILLVQEVDDINWKLPGGKIHSGETIFEAFKREIEEELGLAPEMGDIKLYTKANIPNSPNIRHIILIKELNEEDIVKTDEVLAAEYFNINELPETKFKEHIQSAWRLMFGPPES